MAFKTRAAYLDMELPSILQALRLLRQYPNCRVTLDQVCYVEPFPKRYPEEEAAFRQFVDAWRLAIVGGTEVMLDVCDRGRHFFGGIRGRTIHIAAEGMCLPLRMDPRRSRE